MPVKTKEKKISIVGYTATDTQETSDYNQFSLLPGNRAVDPGHAHSLAKSMLESGNLTHSFPIVVNEDLQVLDGQHRLAALEELGWPVYYRVVQNLTVDAVRAINSTGKNWSWRDFASSYANMGKGDYKDILWWPFNLSANDRPEYPTNELFTLDGVLSRAMS